MAWWSTTEQWAKGATCRRRPSNIARARRAGPSLGSLVGNGSAWGAGRGARWADSPAKRLLDVLLAGFLLAALSPLMLLIALVLKLDSRGPVLFWQERVGHRGRSIKIVKFRTMLPDRRKRARPAPGPDRRRFHKSSRDPRVTRFGRILRRTCTDELPQLWNVLRGDMSLVGPRPELPEIVAQYEPWQHNRHSVKPGVTGWWQVNRDGRSLMHQATELDLFYIDNQSLWLDLLILCRTLSVAVRGRGAF